MLLQKISTSLMSTKLIVFRALFTREILRVDSPVSKILYVSQVRPLRLPWRKCRDIFVGQHMTRPNKKKATVRPCLSAKKQKNKKENTNDRYGCSSRKWWKTVDQITGKASKEVPLFNIFDLNDLKEHFQHINTECHYESTTTMTITDDIYVPIIDENTTLIFFWSTVKRTAAGPDGIGHWFWRDFALELAPAITYLFNLSIKS